MSAILDKWNWLPMMSTKEIGIIDTLLTDHAPQYCLEWGSGNSSVYFPKNHKEIEAWIAVEDEPVYLEILEKQLPENATIEIVQRKDNYIQFPKIKYPERKWDFILVDGNDRDQCLEVALTVARKDAIILLHDAGRRESANMLQKYKDQVEILSQGEQMTRNGYYAHRGLARFYVSN